MQLSGLDTDMELLNKIKSKVITNAGNVGNLANINKLIVLKAI